MSPTPNHEKDAPLVHLGLIAASLVLLLIGGDIDFADWGQAPARWLGAYALLATLTHAASRSLPQHAFPLRTAAWAIPLTATLHLTALLQPEFLLPLTALAALDLTLHRTHLLTSPTPPGTWSNAIASAATLAALLLLAVLIPLAYTPRILLQLSLVIFTGWALITTLALRPDLRSPLTLLGAAGTLSLVFLLLAAPLLPYGPMLSYWILVLSVTLAITTATFTETGTPIAPDHIVHEQTVHPLPDPVIAPLSETVRRYIESGHGAQTLSKRIETALNRTPDGRLLPAMSQARAKGTQPSRTDRRNALAELLDVDPETLEETPDPHA